MSKPKHKEHDSFATLAGMPVDELTAYADKLGLAHARDAGPGELLRLIRARRELLLELDRQALLDICVWARRPVRESAGREELAGEIATVRKMRFDGLSDGGLHALCRLNLLSVTPRDDRGKMIRLLKKSESWGKYLTRKRRRLVGSLIGKIVAPPAQDTHAESGDYQFLPEDDRPLKQQIEEEGLVGGLTRRIKGVADDYVREKLDEIERRIDSKLDEIDRRMGEWRDREIRNRLKIVKITLLASIVVALLSLGYDYVKRLTDDNAGAQSVPAKVARE